MPLPLNELAAELADLSHDDFRTVLDQANRLRAATLQRGQRVTFMTHKNGIEVVWYGNIKNVGTKNASVNCDKPQVMLWTVGLSYLSPSNQESEPSADDMVKYQRSRRLRTFADM